MKYSELKELAGEIVAIKSSPISCGITELDDIGDFIDACHTENVPVSTAMKVLNFFIKDCKESCAFVMMSLLPKSNVAKERGHYGKYVRYYNSINRELKRIAVASVRPRENPNSGNKINILIF